MQNRLLHFYVGLVMLIGALTTHAMQVETKENKSGEQLEKGDFGYPLVPSKFYKNLFKVTPEEFKKDRKALEERYAYLLCGVHKK